MKIPVLIAVFVAAVLPLSGCKFVKTSEFLKKTEQAGKGGDAERVSALIDKTFEAKLVPMLAEKAVDLSTLQTAFKGNLDDAGKQYGLRVGGSGGSWNFAIKGNARVIGEDRKSKAGIANLDIDGDGKTDAILQLGPVVKGTALRDIAPTIYDFSAFRDQIEFAKLGRALNEHALSSISVLSDDLTGKTVSFLGAAAIRSTNELPLIVPVSVKVAP